MVLLQWIGIIIVGALIGVIAGWITRRGGSMNWVITIISGLLGSVLGEYLFGTWGWKLAGMAVFPSIIGATLIVFIVSSLLSLIRKNYD